MKVFVALVLFVGWSSGVIVHSIISKVIYPPRRTSMTNGIKDLKNSNRIEFKDATSVKKQFARTMLYQHRDIDDTSSKSALQNENRQCKAINLLSKLTSRNGSKENSNQIERQLFETASSKNNSLNKRSLIYLSKKLKTHSGSHHELRTDDSYGNFPMHESLLKVMKIPRSLEKVRDNRNVDNTNITQVLFKPNINSKNHKYVPSMYQKTKNANKYILQREKWIKIKPVNLISSVIDSDESVTGEKNSFYLKSTIRSKRTTRQLTSYITEIPKNVEQVNLKFLQTRIIPNIKPKKSKKSKYSPMFYQKNRDDNNYIFYKPKGSHINPGNLLSSPKSSDESVTEETHNLYSKSTIESNKSIQQMASYYDIKIPQSFEQLNSLQALFIPHTTPKNSMNPKYSPPIYHKNKNDKYFFLRQIKPINIKISEETLDENVTQEANDLYSENTIESYRTTPSQTSARKKVNYGFPLGRKLHGSNSQKFLFEPDDKTVKGHTIPENVNDFDLSPLDFNENDNNFIELYKKDTNNSNSNI